MPSSGSALFELAKITVTVNLGSSNTVLPDDCVTVTPKRVCAVLMSISM